MSIQKYSLYLFQWYFFPNILRHTHHGYELGELELEVDCDSLSDVGHGPDQLVVVAQ